MIIPNQWSQNCIPYSEHWWCWQFWKWTSFYVIREFDFFPFSLKKFTFFFFFRKSCLTSLSCTSCRFKTVVHKGIEEKGNNKFIFLTLSPFPQLTFLFRGHMNEQDYSVFSPYTKLKDPALINIHTYYLLTSGRKYLKMKARQRSGTWVLLEKGIVPCVLHA